jgi:hypothetical protein
MDPPLCFAARGLWLREYGANAARLPDAAARHFAIR